MNSYQPLIASLIELGALPPSEGIVIYELVNRAFGPKAMYQKAEGFLKEGRGLLQERFPDPFDCQVAMRGAIGTVFRDLFYRVRAKEIAKELGEEAKQQFLDQILYNPLRLVLDRFLEGRWGQNEFASAAGLDRGAVSRLLKQLLGNEGKDGSLSVARCADVCKRLDIRPLAAGPGRSSAINVDENPLEFTEQEVKGRERQIYRLAVMAAAQLGGGVDIEIVKKFLAGHLLALYGFHAERAERVASAMVSDIGAARDIKAVDRSSKLSDFIRFTLGLNRAKDSLRAKDTLIALDFSRPIEVDSDTDWEELAKVFGIAREDFIRVWDTVCEACPGPTQSATLGGKPTAVNLQGQKSKKGFGKKELDLIVAGNLCLQFSPSSYGNESYQ